MILAFLYPYVELYKVLNLLRYVTFRCGAALFTALIVSFVFGSPLIEWLKNKQEEGQPIRSDGPPSHLLAKKGTPTMGGVLILLSLTISTLLWSDLKHMQVWIVLCVTIGFGILGAFDDYLKLSRKSHHGLSAKYKFLVQLSIACVAVIFSYDCTPESMKNMLAFPFTKDFLLNISYFYFPFAIMVIVGTSNAVNLTDGLDGLAIGPTIIAAGTFCLIAYMIGNIKFAEYLHVHHIAHAGEFSIFLGALIGSGIGFLWFNAPPARIFMGDTGSLAVGGALGTISVLLKHEIVLAITGGLFVIEAISVIIQVSYFKLTRRRIFLMAPIHHHFEKKGWSEPTIVIRFWIIALVLGLIGLSTLKIR